MGDAPSTGAVNCLTVIDRNREGLEIAVGPSLPSRRIVQILSDPVAGPGRPTAYASITARSCRAALRRLVRGAASPATDPTGEAGRQSAYLVAPWRRSSRFCSSTTIDVAVGRVRRCGGSLAAPVNRHGTRRHCSAAAIIGVRHAGGGCTHVPVLMAIFNSLGALLRAILSIIAR